MGPRGDENKGKLKVIDSPQTDICTAEGQVFHLVILRPSSSAIDFFAVVSPYPPRRMPHFLIDDIDPPAERQTSQRESLGALVEFIVNRQVDPNLVPKEGNVAASWEAISAYVLADCFGVQAPGRPERPDWRTIANVEAHFESFQRKLPTLLEYSWAREFPFDEFCSSWLAARQEFYDEQPGHTAIARDFFRVYLPLLGSADSVLPSLLSEDSLSDLVIIDYSQGHPLPYYRSYHTGCSDTLPDDMGPLQLSRTSDSSRDDTLLEDDKQSLIGALSRAGEMTKRLLGE